MLINWTKSGERRVVTVFPHSVCLRGKKSFFLKAIKEIRKLRKQLTSEINLSVSNVNVTVDPEMKPPDDKQARLLRQLLLSGLGDQVARKIALHEVKEG